MRVRQLAVISLSLFLCGFHGSLHPRPNIVVVLTDDQHPASVDWMPQVTSRLAASGIRFSNAFVPTALCCPSRASLFTGQHTHHHGVLSNWLGALAFGQRSALPRWLQDAGYATGIFGKYLNGYDVMAPAVPPGWDTWRVFPQPAPFFDYDLVHEDGSVVHYGSEAQDYVTDVLVAEALAFIQAHAGTPFFLLLAPSAPHLPAKPAPRHEGAFAAEAPWRPPSHHEPDTTDKPPFVRFLQAIFDPPRLAREDRKRLSQLESLLAVDEALGAILDALEALGIRDDTIVVFTSDHGYGWGEHWYYWKEVAYEESIGVPLVLSYPAIVSGPRVEDRLVLANLDLTATIVALAGASAPHALDGASLAPLLLGQSAPDWRTDFLIEHFSSYWAGPHQGVRTADGWKFVRYDKASSFHELYDLQSDPSELENLAVTAASDPLVQTKLAELEARTDALAVRACADGIDNDGDGLADADDPGCTRAEDLSETSALLPCDDGRDNDGDGRWDVRADGSGDPGCRDPAWPREDPQCDDGRDNDRDGGVDARGLDLDGDGRFDGPGEADADPFCVGQPWARREAPACGLGFELVLLLFGWLRSLERQPRQRRSGGGTS